MNGREDVDEKPRPQLDVTEVEIRHPVFLIPQLRRAELRFERRTALSR